MGVLSSVKMKFLKVVLTAKPNDLQTQALRKSCFKIDPATLSRKIGNEEFAAANTCDNFIVNFVVVKVLINTKGSVTSGTNALLNRFGSRVH